MNISIKIRKENFENGEYTSEEYIEVDDVINFFEAYDWVKDSELTNECLIFSNKSKKLFCIEKYSKEVYQLYIIDFSTRYYFHKTTKSTGVIIALNKFINNRNPTEEDKFVKTADKAFVKSFKERAFIYKTSFLVNLSISFVWLTMVFLFLIYCLFIFTDDRVSDVFVRLLILFPLLLMAWIPGAIVHLNYWNYNSNTEIYISSGNLLFILKRRGVEKKYLKSEIKEIIQYESDARAWHQYGYTKIVFVNNTSIFLTNLLINQFNLRYKFPEYNCTVKKRFFPWLI